VCVRACVFAVCACVSYIVYALIQVKTEAGVWDYVKHTVLPAFHHNGTKYIADETNVLIGSAIIRQLRAAPGRYSLLVMRDEYL